MSKKHKRLLIIFLFLLSCFLISMPNRSVKADELSDNVEEQLENIDFSDLEEYLNNLEYKGGQDGFFDLVYKIVKGEYSADYSSVFDYVFKSVLSKIKSILPFFIAVIAIAILSKIISAFKSSSYTTEINKITSFVSLIAVSVFLITGFKEIFITTENVIKNLSKLSDIMSPIIITLMTASGATVSASIYKPTVVFFSNGIINVILYLVLPLIALSIVFYVISKFSTEIKLVKFAELSNSIIKWVIGISVSIFSVYLTVQGLASASHDGISLKAVKYAISNSIPVVGGFLKDGFDLMVAGSVLIKNAVGVGVVFLIINTVLSPLIFMIAFSFGLKLVSATSGVSMEINVSELCDNFSKGVNYLIASLLLVGFMLFITVLLMIISANAFI